ncbi:MAG: DNA topoisomerase IV subunit B, partial [Alphaproteobacteria bacterium]|nr:DNA topoisomerase IV subunit B [Alphaproteobacteria bacterium]
RRRPGMYIGGTDERALHHLVTEVLDNSMDEAVAGHATRIELELHGDGRVSVQDNGRGIPVDPHPKYKDKSALEVILTILHAGGKFSNKAYETSGGLHGVGVSVVNALSSDLLVEVIRDKVLWSQNYSRGHPTSKLENKGPLSNRRGTKLTFLADTELFGDKLKFRPKTLHHMARSKAYLFRGVEIRWKCDPSLIKEGDETPPEAVFHFPNGLADFLKDPVNADHALFAEPFSGLGKLDSQSEKVEWAITWLTRGEGFFTSYCNTIPTPLGGTHENGFRQGITKALRQYGEMTGVKKAAQLTSDDVLSQTCGIVSVFIRDPHFQGQTKDKLVTQGVGRSVENLIKDRCDLWLSLHKEEADALLQFSLERAEERQRRKQDKDTVRQSATKRLHLPGKLADCIAKDREDTEVFLVEGDSAGGSAKQARNRKTQAILPLRGKILNVANATHDKMRANQEITDLGKALGCGFGKDCDPQKLRYGRVIIMTDADVDGAHIASLLLTFFFQQMRPLITSGRVYLALPPLYRLSTKGKVVYAHDDADKERLMESEFKGNQKVEVSRFKGLGEMNWKHLKETTMDPQSRSLLKVKLHQETGLESTETSIPVEVFIENLMGRKPEKRFEFIQQNAQFVDDIDI